MLFIISLRGFDIPCELHDRINNIDGFTVKEKDGCLYIYREESFETDIYENIVLLFNKTIDIVEENAEIFQMITKSGGNINLYVTYHTETTAGFRVDKSIIKRMADLDISLDIDFL